MNNLVIMLVVIAIVIGVIAGVYYFSEQEKQDAASAQTKVGFVYVGPVGDHGWTYEHHQG